MLSKSQMFSEAAIKQRLARKELADPILEKFFRYVKVETTSDPSVSDHKPSTLCQLDLANMLVQELKDFGIEDVTIDNLGYVIANIPATKGFENSPTLMFSAHVDTSPQCSGKNVNPQIFHDYDGKDIVVNENFTIKAKDTPTLQNCIHDTIITTDGNTLLGADDKAGVANIMTALEYMFKTKMDHGPLQVMFSCDEEIGMGMFKVPYEKIKAKQAYTIDSMEMPQIEYECFNAYSAKVIFTGVSIHPGYARGILVNAASMAAQFVAMLPRNESPEATDGRYGFYMVKKIEGEIETATVNLIIRDHDDKIAQERCERLKQIAKAVEAIFPGGKVDVAIKKWYSNMVDYIGENSKVVTLLKDACKTTFGEAKVEIIRGGTDGGRLSEFGSIPTPNIFTGGMNCHARTEMAALSQMVASCEVVIELIRLWSLEKEN